MRTKDGKVTMIGTTSTRGVCGLILIIEPVTTPFLYRYTTVTTQIKPLNVMTQTNDKSGDVFTICDGGANYKAIKKT